jgi:hypothetical protein
MDSLHEDDVFGVTDESIPDARPKAQILSPDMIRRAKQQDEKGWEFTLMGTVDENGNASKAVVRRVSMWDKAHFMTYLPNRLHKRYEQLTDEMQQQRQDPDAEDARRRALEQASMYVVAGFISPRVYDSRPAAEANNGVFVGDIHAGDRLRFMGACEGGNESAVLALRPFSGQQVVDVSANEAGETVSAPVSKPVSGAGANSFGPISTEESGSQ